MREWPPATWPEAWRARGFGPESLPRSMLGLRPADEPWSALAPTLSSPRPQPLHAAPGSDPAVVAAESMREALSPPDSETAPRVRAPRGSAVCVLFIPPPPGETAAHLLLTRRSVTVKTHRGQIALAGGRAEPEDPTPAATALRELEEELGLPRHEAVALGTLPPTTALDGSPVVPVVCAAAVTVDALRPAADEVAYAFTAPWTSFRRGASRPFRFNIFGRWRASQLFVAGSENIWGLTALILHAADLG